jgi:hypothetical protein
MIFCKINQEDINNNNYWNKLVNSLRAKLSQQKDLNNKILVIRLQEINRDDDAMIPKLEYKQNEGDCLT